MIFVNLYSNYSNDLKKFLESFYNHSFNLNNSLSWGYRCNNPIEITEMIGAFIDNSDRFNISMWICLDKDVYINVTDRNADKLIRYLFERYPY